MRLTILCLLAAMFIASRVPILLYAEPTYPSVKHVYCARAIRAYDLGRIPYKEFVLEYPPLGWWVIYAPRLFGAQPHPHTTLEIREAICRSYRPGFFVEMLVCDVVAIVLLWFLTRAPWILLVYTIATSIMANLLYDQMDIALLTLMLAWALCWQKRRITLAYVFLGLGIAYKLIPVLIVPFALLGGRRWRDVAALVISTTLPFAIQFLQSGPALFRLFSYHAERGLSIESLWGSLLLPLRFAGAPITLACPTDFWILIGEMADEAALLGVLYTLCFLAAVFVWAVRRAPDTNSLMIAALYAVSGAVAFSNAVSPQYFLWALPLTLIVGNEVLAGRGKAVLSVLVLIVAASTTWLWPYHYFSDDVPIGLVPDTAPLAAGVLLARSLTYAGTVVWLGKAAFTYFATGPAANHGKSIPALDR